MKRILFSLLAGIALLTSPVAQADNITVEQAKDAAAHYLQHRSTMTRLTVDQLTLARQWNNEELNEPSMYLFAVPGNGWIIMAASTVMSPVIAYSDENEWDGANVPSQMEWWLEEINDLICQVQKDDAVKPLGDNPRWTELANHGLKGVAKTKITLMTSTWNQGDDDGSTYNMLSPVVNGVVCPTGCVATALGQICYYYKYPKQPQGVVNYRWETGNTRLAINFDTVPPLDYSLMKAKIQMSTSYNSRREMSRLAYYLALGMKMDFDQDGSGVRADYNVASAMNRYFKYVTGTSIYRSNLRDTAFYNSLRRDLLQRRPVYMHGSSSIVSPGDIHAAGHAWVCDGYEDNGDSMYHMNWGWGGRGNGWFNLLGNDMYIESMGYNFNDNLGIYVKMVPPADSIVGIREVENSAVLGMPYPNPATINVVLPYTAKENATLQVYNVSGTLVESRSLQAGAGEVTLRVDALPSGIYIYRVGNAHGKFVVR